MHDLLPDWTDMPDDEREKMVRDLVRDGKPASLIARSFRNCTRNSVIGLCTRRKIQLKGKAPKPPAPPKKPKVAARIDVRQVAVARAKPKADASVGFEDVGNDVTGLIGIMALKDHHCRWIAGDPLNVHGYCGKTAKDGSSYCPEHHARVYLVHS